MRVVRSVRWVAVVLAVSVLAVACGDDGDDADDDAAAPGSTVGTVGSEPDDTTAATAAPPVTLELAARAAPTADPALAAAAITAFGADLFGTVATDADAGENVVVSPLSVAVALAMLEPGAVGDAQAQLRALLRIDDPAGFHASMNALEQSLEAREAESFGDDGDPGEVVVRVANAAYLQQGFPFEQAYLDAIGTAYGPVLQTVDFPPDPDAVAHEINAFVADATEGLIPDLIADGVLTVDTVLALVNALYLRASWQAVFPEGATVDAPFTLLDGAEVDVPLMHGYGDSSARGDGWVGATKSYVGGLAMQVILPDEGRFDEVAADLGAVLAAYDEARSSGTTLAVPRFDTRMAAELTPALQALGLTAPYVQGGLLGIADVPGLVLDRVLHEAYVAVDEEGIEAAAATVAIAQATSGLVLPPVPVVLDRPFLFRVYDQHTGATLFVGRVMDPTA
jgi:serpin B